MKIPRTIPDSIVNILNLQWRLPNSGPCHLALIVGLLLVLGGRSGLAAEVTVPSRSRLWLADRPLGPQSPLEVSGVDLIPGTTLVFQASGLVSHGGGTFPSGPEGVAGDAQSIAGGAQDGISDIVAPYNALIGVFLGPDDPSLTAPPPKTFFGWYNPNRDYQEFAPLLKQAFYIGSGTRSDGSLRRVVVPYGATRLLLGTMDTQGWSDNLGEFTVSVQVVNGEDLSYSLKMYPGLTVSGPVGGRILVEYRESVNLDQSWHPLTNFVLTASPSVVFDTEPGRSMRFYRARAVP